MRLRCYTLFDITPTGVTLRRKPSLIDNENDWERQRRTQCNYDTLIQVISLRSLPEDISTVKKTDTLFKDSKFGFLFEDEENQQCWTFDFTVAQKSVFNDGYTELGALYYDCSGVPMLKTDSAWDKLPLFLDITPELRNIYFEILKEDE